MDMFGAFLLVWMAVGFTVGIKVIYVDQTLTEENLQKSIAEMRAKGKEPNPRAIEWATHKKIVLVIMTLAGFYTLLTYIKEEIKKRK